MNLECCRVTWVSEPQLSFLVKENLEMCQFVRKFVQNCRIDLLFIYLQVLFIYHVLSSRRRGIAKRQPNFIGEEVEVTKIDYKRSQNCLFFLFKSRLALS